MEKIKQIVFIIKRYAVSGQSNKKTSVFTSFGVGKETN